MVVTVSHQSIYNIGLEAKSLNWIVLEVESTSCCANVLRNL